MRADMTRMRARAMALAVLVMGLDQLVKWIMLAVVMRPPHVIEVTPFFNIVLVLNRGVSFGLFSGGGRAYWLTGGALIVVGALIVWLWRAREPLVAAGIGLIVGGAIGNVIDRLLPSRGAVVDYLDFYVGSYHWPSFNLADSAIAVGVALIVLDGIFAGRRAVE